MPKVHFLLLFIFFQFGVTVQEVYCQTSIRGRVLSADGSTIPKTVISIRPEIQRDIFSGHYDDIFPDEDGAYQFQINEPGLYRIIFRGVFHHGLSLPVMIYDQPAMTMNVLLMPRYFNDGFYFAQDNYTDWIRVYGNFNNYSYDTGEKFSLNPDGSISAFIPSDFDTLRYQVRGLTYGRGSSVLPQADEFQVREDGSFEAVLYNDLPKDSLEIRYDPGQSILFKRHLPEGKSPVEIVLGGFISFQNQENENWIRPLSVIQPHTRTFRFADWEMSTGISIPKQNDIQEEYAGKPFDTDFGEVLEEIDTELKKTNLHPQQKALLTMSYASVSGWKTRKTHYQRMRSGHSNPQDNELPKIKHDSEILMSILENVPPFHPAWQYNNGAVDYLLTESGDTDKFVKYFHEAVRVHPDDRTVQLIALTMIRHLGSGYNSVEKMPVYQTIVERYGERELARDAHQAFIAGTRN